MEYYPAYPDKNTPAVKEFAIKVTSQLALYREKKGIFGRSWIIDSASSVPAYMWWDLYGASVPELQTVARLILAQPASASIVERINSAFAFVKDRARNGLKHERADKLVNLFHNLRLLKKMKQPNYVEPAIAWTDPECEGCGITSYGI